MLRRRALVVGLAGLTMACGGPASPPTPPAQTLSQLAAQTPQPSAAASSSLAAAIGAPANPTGLPRLESSPASATVEPAVAQPTDVPSGQAAPAAASPVNSLAPPEIGSPVNSVAPPEIGSPVNSVAPPEIGSPVNSVAPPELASLAVMIENQADARPQTGLTHADVVYEALAEGGITRFLAVFLTGDAPVVGPVRSLRHYFAFMAADYGADVVHIGASPEGFAWRDAMNMGHLDESAGDPGVWRIRSRPPPHNAYTDTAADRGFLAQRGRQQNHQWGPLLFDAQAPLGEANAETISLSFRPWAYRVTYAWDASRERYLRSMDGSAHRDAVSGEQIAPAAVVVQFADVEPIANDDKLRLDVNLVGGSGRLVVFSAGTRREGTWSKSAPRTSSVWLDDAGERLMLPPGPVWVEVVPIDSPLRSA